MLHLLVPLMLVFAPASFVAEGDAACSGGLCDLINWVCGGCIPAASASTPVAAADCMGFICDQINYVCYTLFHTYCLG